MLLDQKVCAAHGGNEAERNGSRSAVQPISAMVLGVGAFAYSTTQILKDSGSAVSTYLTRDYAHYSPSLAGPTFGREQFPSPASLIRQKKVDFVIPMSIDWARAPWK